MHVARFLPPVLYRVIAVLLALILSVNLAQAQSPRELAAARTLMVESEVAAAGIKDPAILAVMRSVPRHEFVPADVRPYAYLDMALPIGEHQTISPPFIVAYMTQQLGVRPTDRVLEIGTGSGYQAAILSGLAKDVYTIEINPTLAKSSAATFARLDYKNIHHRLGDGYQGWKEHAPFDRIILTCSPEKVPQPLVEQLAEGGRIVVPLGERYQQTLYSLKKQQGKLVVEAREPTFFVPMTGVAESRRQSLSDEPLTPLANGDFEALLDAGRPEAWYYLRQAQLDGSAAHSGERGLKLANRVPGRSAQALQALGVDGRQVRELVVGVWVKAHNLAKVAAPGQGAQLLVSYFDDNRVPVGQETLGPWQGTFDWTHKTARLRVPSQARVAIVAVGLLGATGDLSCDDVTITAGAGPVARR
jgi:protein-L-isoaspartate(D-aspartate) O-methyltransferase